MVEVRTPQDQDIIDINNNISDINTNIGVMNESLSNYTSKVDNKVNKDGTKVLSDNNYSNIDKSKVDKITTLETDINTRALKSELDKTNSQLEDNMNKNFKQALGNYRNRKPIMTIFDDDGNVGAYTRLFRLAKECGITCVEAVPTGKVGVGQQATLEQLTEMKNAGWDIVSHSHNHVNLSLCTEEEKHNEMRLSKEWLQQHAFTSDVLVYPLGEANAEVRRVARNYYKCAVQIDNVTMVNVPPIRTYAIERVSMKRNTIEQIKAKIDETVAKNGWLAIMCHAYMENDTWTDDQFRDLINYAKSKLEIVNVTEALGIIGNTLDIGDSTPIVSDMNASVIDCDGNVYGQTLGKVRYIVNGVGNYGQTIDKVTNATSPSFFDGGKTTIINISMDDASTAGFPRGRLGTLITHKFSTSSNRYCFQEFWLDEFTKKYRRCWLSYSSSWSEWVQDEAIEIPSAGTYNSTSVPNTFKSQFTIQSILANTSGFPVTTGGTLITSSNSSDFSFQFFKELYTGRIWVRSFKASAWTSWELLSNAHSKALNSVNMTTPITDFEHGITITYFTDTSASGVQGLPESKGGVMTTYRQGTGNGFSYQEYKVKNSFNKYLRYHQDDGSWSAWKQFAYTV